MNTYKVPLVKMWSLLGVVAINLILIFVQNIEGVTPTFDSIPLGTCEEAKNLKNAEKIPDPVVT